MAIKTCRECKKEVSSEAKTCPHCGCKNPVIGIGDIIKAIMMLAVVFFFANVMMND